MKIAYTGRPEAPRSTRKWKSAPGRTDGLGVDLSAHYSDLRAVAFSSYSKRCTEAGVEIEELISVVAERILRSNRGAKPFNPSKASLPRYLHLMCSSRLSVLAEAVRTAHGRTAHQIPTDESECLRDPLDALEGTWVPDAAAVVATATEQVAWEARCDDALAEDMPLAVCWAWDGGLDPEDLTWSGWREQAVRWVVAEAPEVREAARWWGVAATEAARRLQWGRQAWKAHLERIGVCK
jgi:hypothetical protein